MKKNILVFPCGSEIGLDIYSSVCNSTYFHLIGGSSTDDHGRYVYEDYISGIPFVSSNDFLPAIAKIVKDYHIDAIYPTLDFVITILKEHENELGCKVVSSSLETTRICQSKEYTYKKLRDVVLVPKIYSFPKIPLEDYPIFAKPNVGYGSRGVKKLYNKEETALFLQGKEDIMLLEYLPGEEFTVDCFTDKEGYLLYSAARKRNRIKNGISVNTFFVEEQREFGTIAEKINETIRFRGAWFYQVKRNKNDELCLLEIASRLGGSSLLSRAVGVNLALLSLFDTFDFNVEVQRNDYRVELDRALDTKYKTNLEYDSVYCDYDDCLILEKSILNLNLIKFLYKCVNEKKKVCLLSKHHGDLLQELKNYRIEMLFDEIIQIDDNEDKYGYISTKAPIFIDDSYAERKNIKQKMNIPVFSPEMIDVLM